MCKHIGRANAMGRQPIAFAHMEKVNGWNHKMVVSHIAYEFELFSERSKHQWEIDLSILSKNFDVDPKLIHEIQSKPRDVIKHPWKKKRRKKKK